MTLEFIRTEIAAQSYEISLHADDERLADHLTVVQLEHALLNCQMLEHYRDDPCGESCLVVGFTPEAIPVHVVCGRNPPGICFSSQSISLLCQNGGIHTQDTGNGEIAYGNTV